jgi:hypothetical protein
MADQNYMLSYVLDSSEEVVMKVVSWVAGILGIIVALVGVINKLGGAGTINILGEHFPRHSSLLGSCLWLSQSAILKVLY